MLAKDLYDRLESDFILSICNDDWSEIGNLPYITQRYQQRYMGLVIDNATEITRVYTAVFPSQRVCQRILSDGARNALLFVHHPMVWDITQSPVFTDVPTDTLDAFRSRGISMYNLHVPLDANGVYGTTYNLARALGIEVTDGFCEYHGVNVGIIGVTPYDAVTQLQTAFANAVGHDVTLYAYGEDVIRNHKVALVAGGGNDAEVYPYLRDHGVNTFVTGIACIQSTYPPSRAAHEAARQCGVSILSGTHYSTEKFACMGMTRYFNEQGLPCTFVEDAPCMADM